MLHHSPMPHMGPYPSPHLGAILPKKTKKILATYHQSASQMRNFDCYYDDPKLQALRSSFQSWRSVSLAWSFLAVILLASKWYEVNMEVELLTSINKSWLNMSSLMVNVNTSQDSLNSNNDNTPLTNSGNFTKQPDSMATVENDDEQASSSGQQINLSEMIINKNANLKIDIDTFLVEFKNARSTLMLSLIFVVVYILSWSWMAISIRETRVSNDISLKTILLISIFAAVDVAASVGFVMVRLIMYSVKNNSFSNRMMALFTIKSETVDQMAAVTALRMASLKSCSAYVDVFVSVIIGLLTILRIYSVACALSYYRRMRSGFDISQHQQMYNYYQQLAQPYLTNGNNANTTNTTPNINGSNHNSLVSPKHARNTPPSSYLSNGNGNIATGSNMNINSMIDMINYDHASANGNNTINNINNNNNNDVTAHSNNSHLLSSLMINNNNNNQQQQQQIVNNKNNRQNNLAFNEPFIVGKQLAQRNNQQQQQQQNYNCDQFVGFSNNFVPQQKSNSNLAQTATKQIDNDGDANNNALFVSSLNQQTPVKFSSNQLNNNNNNNQHINYHNSGSTLANILQAKSSANNNNQASNNNIGQNNNNNDSLQAIPIQLLQTPVKTTDGLILSPHNVISINRNNKNQEQEMTYATTNLLIGKSLSLASGGGQSHEQQQDALGPFKTLLFLNRSMAEPGMLRELSNRINSDNMMQTSLTSLRLLGQTNGLTALAAIQEQQDQNQIQAEQSMFSQISMIEHFQLEEDDILMQFHTTNDDSNDRELSFCNDYQLDSLVNVTGDISHSSLLVNNSMADENTID